MPQRNAEVLRLQVLPPTLRSSRTRSVVDSVRFLYETRGLPAELPRWSDYFGVVTNQHDTVIAAIHGQAQPDRVWVDRLAVAKRHAGQGIGAALLGCAVEALTDNPQEIVELAPSNGSHAFYGRLGFDCSEQSSTPGLQEVWFTQADVLAGVLTQRAEAGKLPCLATESL